MPALVAEEANRAAIHEAVQSKRKDMAEASLRAFVEQAWHVLEPTTPFVPGIHVDAICEHLQAISENRIKDLIINVPPGSAKSLLTCVFWPAWEWGPANRPSRRWLFGSHQEKLAIRDSVKCRTLIDSPWYQERWGKRFKLRSDQNEKSYFENVQTGYRAIVTVGSGTGYRGDIVVVDDPQSVDDAGSDAKRTTANEWYTGTISSRLNDEATGHHLLIQQRLGEDDTTGHVLAKKLGYDHLVLAEEYDPEVATTTSLGWKDPRNLPGQLMWPQHRNADQVAQLKLKLGSYQYAGQYGQRPVPAGGGIFKRWWFKYWKPKSMDLPPVRVQLEDGSYQNVHALDLPEDLDEQLQSWDMTFKDTDGSDYVSGGVLASKGADRYLLARINQRMDFPTTKKAVEALSEKWPKAGRKLVEDKANGPAVIADLRSKIQGLIAVEPEGGKEARAHACSAQVESGNFYVPHPYVAPWVEAYLHQMCTFPNGKYDDDVDMTTQALIRMKTKKGGMKEPDEPQWSRFKEDSWMA